MILNHDIILKIPKDYLILFRFYIFIIIPRNQISGRGIKYLFLISMMSNLLMSIIASQLSIKNFDIYFVTTSLLNF